MPIYEFLCKKCGRRSSFLIRQGESPDMICEHCGNTSLERVMSRFSSLRSEEDRLESLADPSKWGGLDESDPASVARFVKKMGREMGEDFGDDIDQMADEAAKEAEGSDSVSGEGGDLSNPLSEFD